jgi:hypothetical protein
MDTSRPFRHPYCMIRTKLVGFDGLAEEIGIPARTLRSLWMKKKIPGVRLGHRTLVFDPEKVRTALDKFEVRAVGQTQ